jgi:hypothetical protein
MGVIVVVGPGLLCEGGKRNQQTADKSKHGPRIERCAQA